MRTESNLTKQGKGRMMTPIVAREEALEFVTARASRATFAS